MYGFWLPLWYLQTIILPNSKQNIHSINILNKLWRIIYVMYIEFLKRGGVGISLTYLTMPYFVPSQDLDCQRHMSWSFLCSVSEDER
jgi:hypothetical protein